MHPTTVAIDLAKNVFQLALADGQHRVIEQHRLTRTQFTRYFDNRQIERIVMEACGSAHHCGDLRQFSSLLASVSCSDDAHPASSCFRSSFLSDGRDNCQ